MSCCRGGWGPAGGLGQPAGLSCLPEPVSAGSARGGSAPLPARLLVGTPSLSLGLRPRTLPPRLRAASSCRARGRIAQRAWRLGCDQRGWVILTGSFWMEGFSCCCAEGSEGPWVWPSRGLPQTPAFLPGPGPGPKGRRTPSTFGLAAFAGKGSRILTPFSRPRLSFFFLLPLACL